MKALVVGAGAVGQVFARHLSLAGVEVTFAVRSPEKVHPVTLTQLGLFGAKKGETFSAKAVRDPRGLRFELVLITVPSDALASEWLRSIVPSFEGAIVVGMQPGLDDRARLLELGISEGRLVRGLIGFISFATPLSATDRVQDVGYAYWFPPLSPCAYDGPPELVETVVKTLGRGGFPATARPGLETEVIFFTAGLLVTIRALEVHGWSFRELAKDPSLSAAASAQALAITSRVLERPIPIGPSLTTKGWLIGLAARVAPPFAPFDAETYARVHFTKVAPQSKLLLGDLVERGRALKLPVDALERLLTAIGS